MKKSALRKIYLEKRKSLSDTEINQLSGNILEQFLGYFDLSNVQNIHIFLPIKKQKEVDTWLFIERFWKLGKSIFVPKILDDNLLHYPLVSETELQENAWGILEPCGTPVNPNFDMVIVPLLYSDNQGDRIGYGKGFYDRFLSKTSEKTKKVGVNFFPPNETIADIFPTDIPLDYLVTPASVFSFQSKSIK